MTGKIRFLINAVAGAFIPIKTSSRLYLERALGDFGIVGLPKSVLQELADESVSHVKVTARLQNRNWREGVTNCLDGQAGNVACLLHDDRDTAGRQRVTDELREKLTAILEKHGVEFPPTDKLKGH
ncbi:MAG: hypothetical protein ABIP64_03150 [Burkholderiales bacterium]